MLLEPIFVPLGSYQRLVLLDEQQINKLFGESETNKLMHTASAVYDTLFVNSGIQEKLRNLTIAKEQEPNIINLGKTADTVASATNNYAAMILMVWYGMIIRLTFLLAWVPYFVLFMFAATVDGLVSKTIKAKQFGHPSAPLSNTSAHLLIGLVGFPAVYLILPIPLPPLLFPIMIIVFAVTLWTWLSNLQRS